MVPESLQVWASLCRDEQDGWTFLCGHLPGLQRIWQLVEDARREVHLAAVAARTEKRERWHDWATTSMAKGGAAVFRYVKQGPARVTMPGLKALDEGLWAPGQQGAVDRVARAWTHLWVATEPEQEDLDELCRPGQTPLQACPAQVVRPLSGCKSSGTTHR